VKRQDPLDLALAGGEEAPLTPWPSPRNPALDFSRVNTYERCPLAYQFGYLERRPREGAMGMQYGNLQHQCCDDLISEAIEQEYVGALSLVRAEQIFKRNARSYRLPPNLRKRGLENMQMFALHECTFDWRDVLSVEKRYRADIGNRHDIRGRIDRINKLGSCKVRIIDYKGGSKPWDDDQLLHSKQLGMYELMVRDAYPWVEEAQLTIWHLGCDVRQNTTRTPKQLDDLRKSLARIGDEMETRTSFEAKPGTYCERCDYRSGCPSAWVRR
jgi:RecB family exonuclease